ncbi:type II toxin-antitoxin system PemK/MazF family toxin [Aliarcobacter butzleri]|uniref:type II toxin-antitoxin system PemK/MazF family toxin n=1 Tax=Aliarcobacter butzleri TaxID=28197 RepID=UPI003AF648C0
MEMRPRETRKKENPIPKGTKQIEKEMKDSINARLEAWHIKKKEITNKTHPVNKYPNQRIIFDIKPWTLWWFEAGENIGKEIGSHVNEDNSYFFNRPCIIISTIKSLKDTDDSIVTILPMSTKSSGIGIHKHYVYKLEKEKYPKKGKFKGLKVDSYVICHQIKTIDTKRLIQMVHERIEEEDIKAIKINMRKYIDI